MYQFLFTYFNKKYGLKKLVVENIQSLLNSMMAHSRNSNDVHLLHQILCNNCDEDFRLIQIQIKDTIVQLVRIILQEKYPNKLEAEMKRMIHAITEGTVDDWIMARILSKMYEDEDRVKIELMISDQHEYRVAILMDLHQKEVENYAEIMEARTDLSPRRKALKSKRVSRDEIGLRF